MSAAVPPWLLDRDEVLEAPHAALAVSPLPVRLYVGDLEHRVRDLEHVAEWLRAVAFDLAWPARRQAIERSRVAEPPKRRTAADAYLQTLDVAA